MKHFSFDSLGQKLYYLVRDVERRFSLIGRQGRGRSGVGGLYRIELGTNKVVVFAKLCGKICRFNIRIVDGDRVSVRVSPNDPNQCLIRYRHK